MTHYIVSVSHPNEPTARSDHIHTWTDASLMYDAHCSTHPAEQGFTVTVERVETTKHIVNQRKAKESA